MKLSDLKKTLSEHVRLNIRFILPTGGKLPPHAHVTEVAQIDKNFVDCGGTRRTESIVRLQTWFQDDTDHRLTAGKLLSILDKADFIASDDLEVDVEHEAPFISQFPIARVELADDALTLHLGIKHTACLAEDKCLPPALNKISLLTPLPDFKKSKCC